MTENRLQHPGKIPPHKGGNPQVAQGLHWWMAAPAFALVRKGSVAVTLWVAGQWFFSPYKKSCHFPGPCWLPRWSQVPRDQILFGRLKPWLDVSSKPVLFSKGAVLSPSPLCSPTVPTVSGAGAVPCSQCAWPQNLSLTYFSHLLVNTLLASMEREGWDPPKGVLLAALGKLSSATLPLRACQRCSHCHLQQPQCLQNAKIWRWN